MAHDPITSPTEEVARNREPWFPHPAQREVARRKLEALARKTGRKPNLLVILFDDVGWGDFGCYGGGAMTGAPTPTIDRLAREGLLLTSCYSEPSCTPSRASIMTGRVPMRHGLLIPPMYGAPGGLEGEVVLPQLLSDAGYVTQAVGKWHMGENSASQPHNVGFDDFYGFLSVSDMYSEWRDPHFFPEVVYSDERTEWIKNEPFNRCFVHGVRGGPLENVEEVTIPVLSLLDEKWASYSVEFIQQMRTEERPWFLYHCTRGTHFDNYPHPRFLGASPARHPYKDTLIELDDIVRRLVRALEETGQLENTLIFLSSDNGPHLENWPDAAYTPFRCAKGSTWEGGVRVPGIFAWKGMVDPGRVSEDIFDQQDLFATFLSLAGASDRIPADRFVDSIDQTGFLLAPDGRSHRKFHYYWLTTTFSGLRVGEYKWMRASISDDDADVAGPGGFTGVLQQYAYGRLYNLWLDPKETHSYMTRKLAYIELIVGAFTRHLRTFRDFASRPRPQRV